MSPSKTLWPGPLSLRLRQATCRWTITMPGGGISPAQAGANRKDPAQLWREEKNIRSFKSVGMTPWPMLAGPTNVYPRKLNGSLRLAAEWIVSLTFGAKIKFRLASGRQISGRENFPVKTHSRTDFAERPRWHHFEPTDTGFMTCPATCGSGARTGTCQITMPRVLNGTRRVPITASIRMNPEPKNACSAAVPIFAMTRIAAATARVRG